MIFSHFKQAVATQFAAMSKLTLLRIDVDKDALWDTYLTSFPEGTNPLFDGEPGGYNYSTDWAQGGPIIEREQVSLSWVASNWRHINGCWSGICGRHIRYAPHSPHRSHALLRGVQAG